MSKAVKIYVGKKLFAEQYYCREGSQRLKISSERVPLELLEGIAVEQNDAG